MTPDERQAPDIYDAQGECFAAPADVLPPPEVT